MKKLIFLLSIFVLSAVAAFDAAARYRGDLNGDDRVDLADMAYLAKAINAGSTDKALDVNASGKVDDYDLQKLADIIISGKLIEESGMNVGIGGWEDAGEDFGGTVKAPAFSTRSADETRLFFRNPRSEGDDRYSMEFGISESNEAPAAVLVSVRLPREMQFDATKIVELDPVISSSHKLYGTPKFVKENENEEWSDCLLRFIVFSPDMEGLPSSGKYGKVYYTVGDCWSDPVFRNSQVATTNGDCVELPEHGGDYWGNFKPVEVTSVWFDQTEMNLTEGESGWLWANIDPGDATEQSLLWNSSDESVATVFTEDGRGATVTALNEGETVITATSSNGISASCTVHVEKRFIDVWGIYLNQENFSMTEGDTTTLTATIDPADATDQTVNWWTSDENIATVVAHGKEAIVTALNLGHVEIYAQTSNGLTATCQINVEARVIEVTSVSLDQINLELTEGDTAKLTATVNPSDATDRTLTWMSSDSSVATVSGNGEVTALKTGTATITVSSSNGRTASCEVTVAARIIEVAEVVLDRTSLALSEGDTAKLTATVNPSDATDRTLTWTSSDASVATVSGNGEVTALKPGTATITVSSSNGRTASCAVTVAARIIEVAEVVLDRTSLALTEGDTAKLTATVNPADATDRTLTWTSSDASVAMVSANGEVTALRPGTATITVSSSNGRTASCAVTVAARIIEVAEVVLDRTSLALTEGDTAQLTATVNPADATDRTLTWTSSDASVAMVSANGEVSALRPGTATITVSSSNGRTASCAVTVAARIIEVSSVTLLQSKLEMTQGDTALLTATVNPSDATDKTLVWTSSDGSVASVSTNGEVKALNAGKTIITVSSVNGKSASCEVSVVAKEIEITSILLDVESLELEVGDTHQFVATVLPEDATDQNLEWWIEDERIAIIDHNGFVTMVGEGATTVHVRSVRWTNVEASCLLNVSAAVDGLIADDAPCDIYSTDGQLIRKAVPPSELECLPRGLYIIRQRGKSSKLLK